MRCIGLRSIGMPCCFFNGCDLPDLINKDTFVLSVCAALVSLAGFVSVVYNGTPDYAYATYLISMWVWLSAAYVVVTWMRWVHGTVSVFIVCNYLIVLCVAQCSLALGMIRRNIMTMMMVVVMLSSTADMKKVIIANNQISLYLLRVVILAVMM